MEGCETVRFKQLAVVDLLAAEKISPIVIHRRLQAGYGDIVLMSGQLEVRYGSLSTSKCGGNKFVSQSKVGEARTEFRTLLSVCKLCRSWSRLCGRVIVHSYN
jgi:hypothetical protein